jgi:hypothetical protein
MADSKSQKEYNEQLRQTQSLLASMQREMVKMADAADKRNKKLEQYYSFNKKILGDLDAEENARKKIDKIEEKLLTLGIKRRNASGTEKKQIDDQISSLESKRQSLENTFSSSLSLENINDRLLQLSQLQNDLSKDNLGVNEGKKQGMQLQLQAQEELLKKHRSELQILGSVNNVVDSVTQKYDGIVSSVENGLRKIPLIGDVLADATKPFTDSIKSEINIVSGKFKEGFSKNFLKISAESGSFSKAFSSGLSGGIAEGKAALQGLGGTLSKLGPMLANPFVIAVAAVAAIGYAIYKAFQVGLERFKELDAAAQSFRENTGLLVSQTRGMQENIRAVNVEFANLGVSAQDVAKAASEFVNEFDGLEQPSQAVLGSMVALNKNFGVGTQEAAKLNKVFQNIGGLTAEQSQHLIGQTVEMAKMAGVAPNKVIQDMANSSEYAYKYFQGSPKELAKAAVEAAKLGTSIEEAGKAADNLLNFQDSISSELEAQAMLGVNLNFGQARYLAANGKVVESQQAILDQIQKNVDLTNLNVYEQEALAKAAGMPIESIKNQIRLRERFGPLAKEELAAATALMDAGKDINKITKEDLALQSQRMKSQQDMQSTMGAIQNETGALKTGFMDMMAPLAGFAMNVLLEGLKQVGMVLNPLMKGIGAVARIIFGVFGMVFDLASAILTPIVAIGGAIIDMLVTPFQALATKMQPLFDRFKELKEATMKAVQPILDVFRSLGNMMGEMVGSGPIGMFIDFLTWGLGKIVSIIGGIAKGIAFVLKPIMTLIGYLMEGISFIGKMINDYIIQPALAAGQMVGNVLSTLTFGLFDGDDSEGTSTGGTQGGTQGGTSQVQDIPLMAEGGIVQSPIQAVVGEAGPEAIIPLDQLASVLGGVSAPTNERPSWVDEVVSAIRENKDVYMDKVKVSSTVTDTQERSGRQNRFGLQGA